MLEALEFMHARNFVHRDLRDTSVFVESSGRVRVADFSIDKRVSEGSEYVDDLSQKHESEI